MGDNTMSSGDLFGIREFDVKVESFVTYTMPAVLIPGNDALWYDLHSVIEPLHGTPEWPILFDMALQTMDPQIISCDDSAIWFVPASKSNVITAFIRDEYALMLIDLVDEICRSNKVKELLALMESTLLNLRSSAR